MAEWCQKMDALPRYQVAYSVSQSLLAQLALAEKAYLATVSNFRKAFKNFGNKKNLLDLI